MRDQTTREASGGLSGNKKGIFVESQSGYSQEFGLYEPLRPTSFLYRAKDRTYVRFLFPFPFPPPHPIALKTYSNLLPKYLRQLQVEERSPAVSIIQTEAGKKKSKRKSIFVLSKCELFVQLSASMKKLPL